MIREEHYYKLANEYGTGMGVAEWNEPFYPYYTNVAKMPDEMKVIILTNYMIKEGIYEKGIREIIRLESKYGKKRIKKSTIYEKAIDNII